MRMKKFSTTIFVAVLAAVISFGQAKAALFGSTATPSTTTGATTPRSTSSSRPAASKLPAGTKVDLNRATVDQLDTLPQIGKTRAKVIMDERAKARFKDWADFDTRTAHSSVNKGVKTKIKDLVTF